MSRIEYEIVVIDGIRKRWPSPKTLVALGVPLTVARRYQIVRRDMTAGLKKRIKKAMN